MYIIRQHQNVENIVPGLENHSPSVDSEFPVKRTVRLG